jgi:hypothetical protein
MFHKIMGNLEKMLKIGDIILYFFPYYFNCHTKKRAQKSNWGKINDIFPPCVFICFLLGHAINCSTFTGGVMGDNILSLCVNVFLLCLCFSP